MISAIPSNPSDMPARTPFSFTIAVGGEPLEFSGSVPDGACAAEEMVPVLLDIGEGIVSAAIRQCPPERQISCGPGCGACCRQLVPISLSEADYLNNRVLPALADDHRERVRQRLADAAASLRTDGLLDQLRGLPAGTDPERRQAVGLSYFLHGIPCPFLEDDSCSIHLQRPLACREYLVTSPAAYCARPDPVHVTPLTIPNKPSHALIQLDAAATGTPGWRTLVDALTDDAPAPMRSVADPIRFLKNFLYHLLKPGYE